MRELEESVALPFLFGHVRIPMVQYTTNITVITIHVLTVRRHQRLYVQITYISTLAVSTIYLVAPRIKESLVLVINLEAY